MREIFVITFSMNLLHPLHRCHHLHPFICYNLSMSDSKPDLSKLTPEEYRVTQEKGTEPAFSGAFHDHHEEGMYNCVVCGEPLFSSDTKFDSGTGWPSFYQPVKEENVKEEQDMSHGMARTEVVCQHCGAHLGHVFPDGPNPTGQRYCINSCSLKFEKNSDGSAS